MIGILSDSHDNVDKVRQAVRFFNERKCDLVIHAGDIVAPFSALELKNLGCPVKAVFGNCDGERKGLARVFDGIGDIRDAPLAFFHDGRKFLVYHLNSPAERRIFKRDSDVVVFGHTHRPETRLEGGLRVVNPGEAGGWLHGKSTVALLDAADLSVEIVTLGEK